METWNEISDDVLDATEYTNAQHGWRNTVTGAEVIVFETEGTGMEDVTDAPWAAQHPSDEEEENTSFFDSEEAAVGFATEYINDHRAPDNTY